MSPKTKFRLALWLRPVAILFVPMALVLFLLGASFWLIGAWLVVNGLIGFAITCPQCGQSNYWDEAHPYKTLLAQPHEVCTRCGFNFVARH